MLLLACRSRLLADCMLVNVPVNCNYLKQASMRKIAGRQPSSQPLLSNRQLSTQPQSSDSKEEKEDSVRAG